MKPTPPQLKYMVVIAFTLLAAIGITAQQGNAAESRVYAGGVVGVSSGLGFNDPSYGVTAGIDKQIDRYTLNIEGEAIRVCKSHGGCGYQLNGRGTVARYLTKAEWLGVQGGVMVNHYSVRDFDKQAVQLFGGVRLASKDRRGVAEINYRHDLTSQNRLRTVEGRVTAFTSSKLFIRVSAACSRFDAVARDRTGCGSGVAVGIWH